VTFPAFKAGDAFLRGTGGGFDFHTPPPQIANSYADIRDVYLVVQRRFSGLLVVSSPGCDFQESRMALSRPSCRSGIHFE
jgi:hypothetical protein